MPAPVRAEVGTTRVVPALGTRVTLVEVADVTELGIRGHISVSI